MIEIITTEIPNLLIIQPAVYKDYRGCFFEPYNEKRYNEKIKGYSFVQDSEASSNQNVIRGLHFQLPPFDQTKLVRCIMGKILDVVVDIRKGSPTFAKHLKTILSGENKKQLLIPKGFAHGYKVLSKRAIFFYKVDNFYSKECDYGILYNDSNLNIDWEIPKEKIIISERDETLPLFKDAINPFTYKS